MVACEASVSVLFRSKGHAKNRASKRGGGGEERKESGSLSNRGFESPRVKLQGMYDGNPGEIDFGSS